MTESTIRGTPCFTEDEIEAFCSLFKSMGSYREEDNSISSADVPPLIELMNWDRSEAQVNQYVEFWNKNFKGRMPMDLYINILKVQHDKRHLLREYAISFDQDKNGFISREEFQFGFETLLVHDPTLTRISYEDFCKEADTYKDGKISIEELTNWLYKTSLCD